PVKALEPVDSLEPIEGLEPVEAFEPVEAVEPAPIEPAPIAPVSSKPDLDLTPTAPAGADDLELVVLEPEAEAGTPSAAVPEIVEPAQESALGIELLPQDE